MTDIFRYDTRKKKIGSRIKDLRKKAGLNQKDLAAQMAILMPGGVGLSINQSTISSWEKGVQLPPLPKLLALSDIFHCDISYLLCDYDREKRDTADVAAITGLSYDAASRLAKANGDLMESLLSLPELSALLLSEEFWSILSDLSCYRIACQAIKSRPVMAKEAAEKARLSESEEEVESYRQAIERHKKDYNFSIKDKEILLFGIQKRLFRIADKIEKEVQNG